MRITTIFNRSVPVNGHICRENYYFNPTVEFIGYNFTTKVNIRFER